MQERKEIKEHVGFVDFDGFCLSLFNRFFVEFGERKNKETCLVVSLVRSVGDVEFPRDYCPSFRYIFFSMHLIDCCFSREEEESLYYEIKRTKADVSLTCYFISFY